MSFPKDFIWGTATASFQIEGASKEDGKSPSIWDDFCAQPGHISDNSNGDMACDHYHRYREDVALMASLGVKAYRFSIAWPRVIPTGTGEVNEAGLQFYSDLVDCLLEHGIRPFVTLYHWDLPRALHQRGAWLNDEMPEWFAAYTRAVAEKLGDRVKDFITINEPQCITGLGYETLEQAPGIRMPLGDVVHMTHNVMKSHGRACQVLREVVPGVRIGYAPCGDAAIPATNSPADIEAARKAYFAPALGEVISFNTAWYSDPVVLGRYPEDGLKRLGQYLPKGWEEDLELIHQPLDFYCQNIYHGSYYRAADNEAGFEQVPFPDGFPRTAMSWPVTPEALQWGPKFLYERYKLPLFISENGMACHDMVDMDGKVHDPNRIQYIREYLQNYRKAGEDGVDLRGYFYWSLLDNFEWAFGYTRRFGLVYVNYQTQQRIPKDSFAFYSKVIAENGENL